eukprot:scaffold456_cov390-Prasinococcus_capsulatus_cf.AAC.7
MTQDRARPNARCAVRVPLCSRRLHPGATRPNVVSCTLARYTRAALGGGSLGPSPVPRPRLPNRVPRRRQSTLCGRCPPPPITGASRSPPPRWRCGTPAESMGRLLAVRQPAGRRMPE